MVKQKLSFVGNLFDDVPMGNMPVFGLENRRYLGCKSKLAEWILSIINNEAQGAYSFFDIFAGTGAIGRKALEYYQEVIFNDFLCSNVVSFKAFFADGELNEERVQDFIREMNNVDASSLYDNYCSHYYGNKYFGMAAAKKIGFIRDEIERRKNEFSEKEYFVLVASLIYSADRIANTTGQFEAYRKNPARFKDLDMRMVDAKCYKGVKIYNEDANVLARRVKCDIVYMDPPYNSRQYCSMYHVLENLAKWDKPPLYRDTAKPLHLDNKSDFCKKKAIKAFTDLVTHVDARYIAVSYSNTYDAKSKTSNNKMTLEEIRQILELRGTTKVFYMDYKPFNAGKTELVNHQEILFLTKVII